MQGWSPDFIPKLTGDAVAMGLIDQVLTVPGAEAMHCSKRARAEGRHLRRHLRRRRPSPARCRSARKRRRGPTVLCMLPDTGERYLSTPLFADIPVDMTEEELGIMRSTPSCQLPPKA